MNCVRLYINWAAIETEPGAYSDEFFRGLDQHIAWANAHGVYVLLDIHQDLYSGAIPGGNGAPAWATLDDGQPHITPAGAPWGAAYFTSPKVHQAFDSFWANRAGPGGVGLQDRFAAAARGLALRYADNPGVIGIDLYNEPGLGSDVSKVVPALMAAAPKLMALPDPPQGLLAMLGNPDALAYFTKLSERRDIYLWALDAITPVLQSFEREKLQPFYDRVGQAIRAATPEPILFFEPAVLANSGAHSVLRPMQSGDGAVLPNQAYAPHAYDLVTDTGAVDQPSAMRLEIMFDNLRAHASAMKLPALVGEWGGYYGSPRARGAAQLVAAQFEQHRLGDLYWDYERALETKAFFDQLCRPVPLAVAGALTTWRFDQGSRTLSLAWTENGGDAPTRIYVPRRWYSVQPSATVTPEATVNWSEIPGADGGWYLDVLPAGSATRALTLHP